MEGNMEIFKEMEKLSLDYKQICVAHYCDNPHTSRANSHKGYTSLHYAVENGSEEIIKLLLNNNEHVNIDIKTADGRTPLHIAAQKGYVQIAEHLLNHGADIHSVCSEVIGRMPLHFSCEQGNEEAVSFFLSKGANVNAALRNNSTPLHIVVEAGRETIVELLLKHGANVNAKDLMGRTPLYYTVRNCDAKMTRLLLTNGANIKDNPELLHITVRKKNTEMTELLLNHGADVDIADNNEGYTPLHYAVENGSEEIIKLLLNNNEHVNIDIKTTDGRTPLHIAAQKGYVQIAEHLLNHGADIHSVCSEVIGRMPLHFSCEQGNEEAVSFFLSKGADINATIKDNSTPLHIVVKAGRETIVELLLKHGANVNAKDERGKTPLYYALQNCDAKTIKLLLTNGADIKDNPELLHCAAGKGWLEIVEDLLKCGTDVHMLDYLIYGYGRTPLHIAVKTGQEEVAKLLITYGANVNAKDGKGKTPLSYAVEDSEAKITKLLLTNGANIKDSPELLHSAAREGCLEIVEDLLKCGADVHMLDDSRYGNGGTPLHSAVMALQEEVAKLLVTYGANVNAEDESGETPLFYAVQNSDEKIVKLLLSNGANVKDDPELLYFAADEGRLEIVEELLKRGAYVNVLDNLKDGSGLTLLHMTILKRQEDVAEILVTCGANVNAKDEMGKTPLYHAVRNCDAKIMRLLLTNGANIKDSPELLYTAADKGCLEIVEELLKCGADVNMLYSRSGSGGTPLHSAVMALQEEVAKLLITYGANVNAKDERGKTPLFYAVQNSDEKIIKLLLTNGANIKDTPELLYTAAREGCLEIVEDLLKCGADVHMLEDSIYGNGGTPLHSAVMARQEEVAKLLVTYGANVNAKDGSAKTPLSYAIQNSDTKIIRLLLTNGANIEDHPEALHCAAGEGWLEIVEDLLKCGADVHALNYLAYGCGGTPLHIALKKGQEEVAKLLVTYGANVNGKDKRGKTPLSYAIENCDAKITRLLLTNGANIKDTPELLYTAADKGCLEIVEELLKCGADVNMLYSRSGSGGTPLHIAVTRGREEVAKLLVTYGANVNAKDGSAKTPLSYAIQNSDTKIIRLLLTNGANIEDHPEALHCAAGEGWLEIVEDLLKCGADVHALHYSAYGSGCTPLHIAVKKGQEEVAKLLITYGANVNIIDGNGETPLFHAIRNSDAKIARLLSTNGAKLLPTTVPIRKRRNYK